MKHQYATLTNRWTGRTTRLRLESNGWASVKNYRAALVRIASWGQTPTRSNVEFTVYDGRGPCQLIECAAQAPDNDRYWPDDI
jgi:hypothetical protein